MYASKTIGLLVLMAACAAPGYAQDNPAASPSAPTVAPATVPPGPDAASSYEWAKSAEKERFAYETFANRDEQLSRWCKTGFAPAELCARQVVAAPPGERAVGSMPSAAPPVAPPPPARPAQQEAPQAAKEAPAVVVAAADPIPREITEFDGKVIARLVYPDGQEEPRAKIGTELADGSVVVKIAVGDGVYVRRKDGKLEKLRGRGVGRRVLIPLSGPMAGPMASGPSPAPVSGPPMALPQSSLLQPPR